EYPSFAKNLSSLLFRGDAFCTSRLLTARRFAWTRAGTACPSDFATSLASDIRYVKYCGTESSRCLILWSSHSQTLLTQATNQEDKRLCFLIVMRMRRSAQPSLRG